MTNTSIVIVTYNSEHLLRDLFKRLQNFQTLVFDNASSDNTATLCEQNLPEINLIKSDVNIGYGRAANSAIGQIDTPYALLLNPDVDIDAEQLKKLLQVPSQLKEDWLFIAPNTGHAVTHHVEQQDEPFLRIIKATGCALLFNVKNFFSLGGFDKNIFLYYEEMDLCIRADHAKFKMYYAENILIPHHSRQSSAPSPQLDNLRNWHFQWSSLYYKKKHKFYTKYYSSIFKNLTLSFLKQCFTNDIKTKKIKQKRAATLAFLQGQKAFINNDQPFIPSDR